MDELALIFVVCEPTMHLAVQLQQFKFAVSDAPRVFIRIVSFSDDASAFKDNSLRASRRVKDHSIWLLSQQR